MDWSTGAGRAKLRLSRGFPGCLACDVIPYETSRSIDPDSWVRITWQDDAKSTGSDRASPYLPRVISPMMSTPITAFTTTIRF